MHLSSQPVVRRAFTLVELIAVIVVLAVLSAVAIPKYFDYTARARESTVRGILGATRSAIANFHANTSVTGTSAYPTLVQLQTAGTVLQDLVPENPYNDSATILAASWSSAQAVSGVGGWNYDATTGRFWANSNDVGENAW
ncbi:MAG: prepilin-type N-terminal cleavage/methylation domain-containing protein [Planctomycetota bacterium]|nr:prepilin-type N-terminal cleavage/methylation domain-containing protein [Planctomycetota bacterium]